MEDFMSETNNELEQILKIQFGLNFFRKGQKNIIESVLKKNDTLAVMPTGGGKSLCYQFPSVKNKGLVVVISPLIALMKDQVQNLKRLGLKAGCLHSAQNENEKKQVFREINLSKQYILYLSPERVQKEGFSRWIQKNQNLVLFAIDEAHCVSQWGPDFREDYNRLKILRQLRPDTPILALTATATPEVLRDISRQLNLKDPKPYVYGFYRPNLYYQVEVCADENERISSLLTAIQQTPNGRILIYCGTRKSCEQVAIRLSEDYQGVSYYHAGLSPETRKATQDRMLNNEIRILAATNAFGMGIDYPDVRLVVHYQMPANIESLYQEMGRAGRDGKNSTCLLLYAKKDRGLQSFFIQQSRAEPFVIQRRWSGLEALTQFIEGGDCRHSGILTYFQDSDRIEECGHCDVCAPRSDLRKKTKRPLEKIIEKLILKKQKSASLTELTLNSEEAKIRHDRLKEWRKAYAKKNDIPAFMVFSNKTLVDIANKNPTNKEQLREVYGFGAVKVESIGAEVLNNLNSNSSSEFV